MGVLPFAIANMRTDVLAQTAPSSSELPPILFVHGRADDAHLSLAVCAFVRCGASAGRAPARSGGRRRRRGYFGLPPDVVLFDGKEPADVKPGVPTDSSATLRLPAADVGRSVVAEFNEERIVARAWPASENRIAVVELTY